MDREARKLSGAWINKDGFTLIELLVVMAMISLLLATLLPALGAAKRQVQCVACKAQLRNIAVAWRAYLDDYDDYFYQGLNANHNFGGWKGEGGYGFFRPLNKYLGLPSMVEVPEGAEKFLCPADEGGVIGLSPEQRAFHYFGNSYQANFFVIGPDRVGVPPGHYQVLHTQVNRRLARIRSAQVDDPSHLLLAGDNNWINQWYPFIPETFLPANMDWHGRKGHYNMTFLDGRVELVKIERGVYVAPNKYRILPFRELDYLAYAVQQRTAGGTN